MRADAGLNGKAAVQAQDWDRVCVEILRGMRGFDLPTYLTGGQPTGGLRTIRLFANPIEPVYEALLRWVAHLRRALGRSKMLVVLVSSDGSD